MKDFGKDFGKDLGKDFGKDLGKDLRELGADLAAMQADIVEALGVGGEPGEIEQPEREFDEQYTVGPHPQLSLHSVSGQIRIERGEAGIIRVRAHKNGSSRTVANTLVEVSQQGDHVDVRTRGGQSGWLKLGSNLASVDFEISVPPGCEVQVKTVSADVAIQDTNAGIRAETVSGDISLSGVEGGCSVGTVSGDVIGERVTGELLLRTTSGDAAITRSHLQSFNLTTVSGDLVIESPLTAGEHYLIKTTSGDVRLSVPEETGATVQMKSVSGDVVSELPAEIIKSGRRSWQGRINGGGANVEMNSVSGDLRIARSATPVREVAPVSRVQGVAPVSRTDSASPPRAGDATEPAVPVREAEEPAKYGDTLSILKALEVGEITLEEATRRLEALE